MNKINTPKKAESGMLVCSQSDGFVKLNLQDRSSVFSISGWEMQKIMLEGNDRVLSIALIERATELANEAGFRITGNWDGDGEVWTAPIAIGPTPTRTARIDDVLWEKAKRRAKERNTNVSAIIVEAIRKFVNDEVPPMDANLVTGVYEIN